MTAAPQKYRPTTSFTQYAQSHPVAPLRGQDIDAELNSIKAVTDAIIDRLAQVQRDDGAIANGTVGPDQLQAVINFGLTSVSDWLTGANYAVNNGVWEQGVLYRCLVAHLSAPDFATDLAAGRWSVLIDAHAATQPGVDAATAQAGNSANSAAASAASANQSAASATASQDSATASANSATASQNSATASAGSAAASDSSRSLAQEWADKAVDTEITGNAGKFSARHWATKAQGWAASVFLPLITGNAGRYVRAKMDESGLEYRTPAQARGDLSLGAAVVAPLVRQTVLDGPVDANGVSATIAASATALGVDLKATASNGIPVTWANGFTVAQVDIVQTIPLDLANYWAALPTQNTSYLAMDYVGGVPAATPTAVQTLAPPQIGRTYSQTAQSVLQFGGAPGSTTFLDDFGNTWTAQGAAKVQNAQFKFGTGALGGGGAGGALNGSSDFIKCSAISAVGFGGWALRAWANLSSLPGAGLAMVIASGRGGTYGVDLMVYNNAGTIKFGYNLSSNASSFNVASNVQGTTTPVIGTWYFVELTFDQLAGVYRLYVNGSQEASTASTGIVMGFNGLSVGATNGQGAYLNGYIDKFEFLPYCQHPAGTAYVPPAAAPNVAAPGYASDWFDTVNYQMKSVSGPSVAAGANPAFAQKNRLYIGEADTVGGVVSTVRPYAIAGEYLSPWSTPLPGAGTLITKNDNLGTDQKDGVVEAQLVTAESGYISGQVVNPFCSNGSGLVAPLALAKLRNSTQFNTGAGNLQLSTLNAGADVALTAGYWLYRVRVRRRW